MAVLIVFVVIVAALGVAAYVGWLPDTRDPEFGLGRIVDGPRHAAAGSLGGRMRP